MTPNDPLVSIITPSFNQGAYLEYTIRSVLAQDYPNVEYLIVDGGSSDDSVAIIRKYAHLAPKRLVWWVSEPDSGQAEAINKGLQHARGEVIAWLNSDDIYLPSAIRQAVTLLEDDPAAGFVFGDAITIDSDGRPLNRLAFADWGLADLASFRIICQPAVFMRRSVLAEAGYLDPNFHFMLDHQLWLRMALLAPIRHAPGTRWAAARHHPAAKNVAQAKNFGAEILRLMNWIQLAVQSGDESPDRTPLNPRHVIGGAYRLRGRYLLDGGAPGPALLSYWRALINWPDFALRHWRRMIYAALLLFRLAPVSDLSDSLRDRQSERKSIDLSRELQNHLLASYANSGRQPADPSEEKSGWPGLNLATPHENAPHGK